MALPSRPGYNTPSPPAEHQTEGAAMSDPQDVEHNTSRAGLASGQSTSLTLLQRLQANESAAWDVMVKLYTPLVYHWCARGGVRGSDVEDVAQEVFRSAAGCLERFRRDRPGDSFRRWLRGITRHKVLEHFRHSARNPQASGGTDALLRLNELADSAPEPGEEDDPTEELNGLRRRALELVRLEFEERTWQAFWLTVIEGRSPVDIAPEMGVSPTAIRMAKSRVLRRLKEEFGDMID